MGSGKTVGIVAGISAGVIVVFILIMGVFLSEAGYQDDARLAEVRTDYNEETDRLILNIILTDTNADYTKVSGELFFYVKKDGNLIYNSEVYSFEPSDFVSWRDNSGNKITGYIIEEREYFSGGSHDLFVTMETKTGRYWEDLHASFYSLN